MKKIFLATFFLSFTFLAIGQLSFDLSEDSNNPFLTAVNNAPPFAATITAADLKSYLEVIASDEMEGRETGTEGQRRAADYIAAHFEKLGLPAIGSDDSYFQKIAFTSEKWDRGQIKLDIDGKKSKHLVDFYSFPSTNSHLDNFETEEVLFHHEVTNQHIWSKF